MDHLSTQDCEPSEHFLTGWNLSGFLLCFSTDMLFLSTFNALIHLFSTDTVSMPNLKSVPHIYTKKKKKTGSDANKLTVA